MKFASNCTLLAAALSQSYRTYNEYQPDTSSSLEEFLDDNGVLVTMCMRYRGMIPWKECTRKQDDSRLSASWIQQDKTQGFRVIGKPVDTGPPVGIILKPTATKIRCVYPIDAATDGRDNTGCGPSMSDPKHGSAGYDNANWVEKWVIREQVIHYRNKRFGKNRTFESIPCSEFYPDTQVAGADALMGLIDDEGQKPTWKFTTEDQYVIDNWSYIMGKSVCNQTEPAPKPDFSHGHNMVIFQGPQFWAPNEWSAAIQLMGDALNLHPNLYIWNELVLDVPTGTEEEFANHTVQAVFYIQGNGVVADNIARVLAFREGRRMNKPVMYVDLPSLDNKEEDLFHCPHVDLEVDDENDETQDAVSEPASTNFLRRSIASVQ